MFKNDNFPITTGKKISFYGSDGFCLFKYFTRSTDKQRVYSLYLTAFNIMCVIITTVSYILIQSKAIRSGRSSGASNSPDRNKKLQRKVMFLILTNILTLIPFLTVCIIHFTEVYDTSRWHGIFSIVELPINSLINPLGLYDEFVITPILKIRFKLITYVINYNN